MINEIIRAFCFVLVAELGDKTQLLAMSLATKYSLKKMYLGMFLGLFLNHGVAIILGKYISLFASNTNIQLITGTLFVVFGIMSLIVGSEESEAVKVTNNLGPIMTIASIFFVGELGDKTQITAMALSANATYRMFILLGTISGVLASCTIGIIIGKKLYHKIPELYLKGVTSSIFMIVGFSKLLNCIPDRYKNSPLIILSGTIICFFCGIVLNHRLEEPN